MSKTAYFDTPFWSLMAANFDSVERHELECAARPMDGFSVIVERPDYNDPSTWHQPEEA